jgi:hypothetical protein
MTKEKRMRMKREKKNLRRKNEMKRKKNLKSSLPTKSSSVKYSPIKFDKFGRVCRFVNKKGDVLPTDTEMFGCEIVRDLPDNISDFTKMMGLGEVIKVPVTNHEVLTGSGESGECITNSHMLSLSIGGHRLLGYNVLQINTTSSSGEKITITRFHHHSVWITPEGKTRCVTDYGSRYKNDREIWFIPVGINSIEQEHSVKLREFMIDSKSNDILFMDTEDESYIDDTLPKKVVEKYIRRNGNNEIIFIEVIPHNSKEFDLFWIRRITNSHFGKVSSTTGRSWDYFKNKILNTYFPTSLTLKTPKIVI